MGSAFEVAVLGWYGAHRDEVHGFIEWGLRYNLFLNISALMYVIFAVGLFGLGARHHAALVHGEVGPGQFPEGYFTMFAVQLVPLTVTGFVLLDGYIIATRIGTLFVVVIVYAMVSSRDGTFTAFRYRAGLAILLSSATLGTMVWLISATARDFVHDYEKWIAWISVAVMLLFVIRGQWAVAKALFRHYLQGNYTVKRFSLQMVRLIGFATQAVHYGFRPTAAAPLFGYDPIFMQAVMGTLGVVGIILGSVVGFIIGSRARHRKIPLGTSNPAI
jgi:hypothetical protein